MNEPYEIYMPNNTVTIGKTIAYMSFALRSNRDIMKQLSQSGMDDYKYVHEIYQSLIQSKPDTASFYDIPNKQCKDDIFLDGNDHFFVSHILVDEQCDRVDYNPLARHLNDCFSCFQIYSQFFKDYYQGLKDISEP